MSALVYVIFIVLYILLVACFIGNAINCFMKNMYFLFGLNLTFAVYDILMLAKLIFQY